MSFSQLDYCQYLLSSQTNYTLTNLSKHLQKFSHDTINSYLRKEKFTAASLWQNLEKDLQRSQEAAVIFDDTLLDKRPSESIELVRRQYSGTEHQVLLGIGLINCSASSIFGLIYQCVSPIIIGYLILGWFLKTTQMQITGSTELLFKNLLYDVHKKKVW